MSWRRWALVLQILLAAFLVFTVVQIELGFLTPRSNLLNRVVCLCIGGFSIYAIFAAIGILKRKAWGYVMEVPVILLMGAFLSLRAYYRSEDEGFPGMNQVMAVLFAFGVIWEAWGCARTGNQLLKNQSNPTIPSPQQPTG